MKFNKTLQVVACDLPNGVRRIDVCTSNAVTGDIVPAAHIDLFTELADIARESPTMQRELTALLLRALAHHADAEL